MLGCVPVLLALAAGCWSGSLALGPRIHCPPCDDKAISVCGSPPPACHLVKEPGCGCCLTCARDQGRSCGVYTEVCAAGLQCLPKPREEKPLHALLHGRGICSLAKTQRRTQPTTPEGGSPEAEEPAPEGVDEGYVEKPPARKHVRLSTHKEQALRKDREKRLRISKIISSSENTAQERLQSAYKHEAELGPCRRQMDVVLQSLRKEAYLSPHEVYIPNCDRKGLYKRKQCKPSKGKRRGLCWCVDKHGFKLPGSDYMHHDAQCHTFESD
ncbi:insulin-like growth factor-binding protein 5 [Leucoraja erinacea]|uniref:insulin-like growth factor-binding protein 5 n=1 Tax=Leucoraja erinaceus TaxID=7782 RepID=UPI002455C9B6|nr:insulin-like growth factor-binding protein 5 [Leucoraja erinacea]